jgi:hypothetical protein
MAEKITITSDGSVDGTTVKYDGADLTKDYKVTSVSFDCRGGREFTSEYSGNKIVLSPNVNYYVSYIDGDKMKSIGISNTDLKMEYSPIGNPKDALTFVGIKDETVLKTKLVDELDKLRVNNTLIPAKDVLEKRTIESLIDKYNDIIVEVEKKAKEEKEKK